MTPAYIKCVKDKFEAMRDSGELSRGYIKPTRAFIRNECLRLYPVRSGHKDKETLAEFFEYDEADGTLLETIDRVDLEDLRALQNFLSGGTTNPNYKVVEMMAWLTNFQPRPYDPNVDYSKIEVALPPKPDPAPEDPNGPTPPVIPEPGQDGNTTREEPVPPEKKKWKRKIIAIIMLVVIAGLTVFTFLKKGKKSDECMYWAGDHYKKGACIQREGDSVLAPLDPVRLRNFKRITDTTLITRNSIGKVWYRIKIKEYEFYTSGGKHPIDIQISLRRLTKDSYEKFKQNQIN